MRFLVTGGAGYIGSVLVEKLLFENHEVVVLDNFMYKQNSLNHLCHDKNLLILNGDIRDKALIDSVMRRVDVIVPLAAFVGAPLCSKDPWTSQQVNFDAMKYLFDQKNKNQIIVMPTTNSAYGSGDADNYCDESSPLKPLSSYAKQKVELERSLVDLENAVSLRLATVFGASPRMRVDLLVNDFVYRAVSDGYIVLYQSGFRRNYIHVRDVASSICFMVDNIEKATGEVYNVGLTEANLSKLELCERIQKYIPQFVIHEEEYGVDPDQRDYIVSNAKIEKLGWAPSVSLDSGLTELTKLYKYLGRSGCSNV